MGKKKEKEKKRELRRKYETEERKEGKDMEV